MSLPPRSALIANPTTCLRRWSIGTTCQPPGIAAPLDDAPGTWGSWPRRAGGLCGGQHPPKWNSSLGDRFQDELGTKQRPSAAPLLTCDRACRTACLVVQGAVRQTAMLSCLARDANSPPYKELADAAKAHLWTVAEGRLAALRQPRRLLSCRAGTRSVALVSRSGRLAGKNPSGLRRLPPSRPGRAAARATGSR